MENEKRLDVISRKDLIKAVQAKQFAVAENTHPYEAIRIQGKYFREVVDNAPTVDAVVLPCEIGREVFYIWSEIDDNSAENFTISIGKIVSFSIQKNGLWAYCRYEDGLTYWHKVIDDFGTVVFLTREEVESALAKMDGDGNG